MTQEARGNNTRQANKALRKQKILDEARELIATQGFEALCGEMVVKVNEAVSDPDLTDPIEAVGAYIENLLALYRSDQAFYRAAFVAGDRTGLFEHLIRKL